MILVTIITPVFNFKKMFLNTLNSFLKKIFTDWEWIIIEDCSSDGSCEFIRSLSDLDERIIVLRNEKKKVPPTTKNVSLKNAHDKYIIFLDSDDCIDENYLENQIIFMQNNGSIISFFYRQKNSNTCTNFYIPDIVSYKLLLKDNPLSCFSTMYDKKIIG